MMLRIIGLIILLITFSWIAYTLKSKRENLIASWKWICEQGRANFQNAVYTLALMCVLILAITGLIPFLILGKPLSGILLLIHVTGSPLFIISIVVLTILWSHKHRFNKRNWEIFKLLFSKRIGEQSDVIDFLEKICFWLIILFSIGLGAIVLSMYPLFGTMGMDFFMQLHQFSAIMLTVCVAIHTYLKVRYKSKVSDN